MPPSRIRSRFTVRRLMVAVAVAGIALGFREWMHRRSERFLDEVFKHRRHLMFYDPDPDPHSEESLRYHWRMLEKYEFAHFHPWLPVEPDPSNPPDSECRIK